MSKASNSPEIGTGGAIAVPPPTSVDSDSDPANNHWAPPKSAVPDRLTHHSLLNDTAPTFSETDDQYDTDSDLGLSDDDDDNESSELSRAFAETVEAAQTRATLADSAAEVSPPANGCIVTGTGAASAVRPSSDAKNSQRSGAERAGVHRARPRNGTNPPPKLALSGVAAASTDSDDLHRSLGGSVSSREYTSTGREFTTGVTGRGTASPANSHSSSPAPIQDTPPGLQSPGCGKSSNSAGSGGWSIASCSKTPSARVGQHRTAPHDGQTLAYSDVGPMPSDHIHAVDVNEHSKDDSFSENRHFYATPRPNVPIDKVSVRELITSYENLIHRNFVTYNQEKETREKLHKRKSRSLGRYTGSQSRDFIEQHEEGVFVPGKKMGRGARLGAYFRKKRSVSRKGATDAPSAAETADGLSTQSEDLALQSNSKSSHLLERSHSCDSVRALLLELGYGTYDDSVLDKLCQRLLQQEQSITKQLVEEVLAGILGDVRSRSLSDAPRPSFVQSLPKSALAGASGSHSSSAKKQVRIDQAASTLSPLETPTSRVMRGHRRKPSGGGWFGKANKILTMFNNVESDEENPSASSSSSLSSSDPLKQVQKIEKAETSSPSSSRRNKKEKRAPESKILLTKRRSRHELMDLGILNVWVEEFPPEDPDSPYLIQQPCSGFHLELGQVLLGPPRIVIDDQEEDSAYYSQLFVGAQHSHYIGIAEDVGPVVLSVLDSPHESAHHGMLHCAFRSYKGIRRVMLNANVSKKELLRVAGLPSSLRLKKVPGSELEADLLKMEDKDLNFRRSFTIGVLYGTAEQGEDERFHNTTGSPAFEEFLDFLGDRIRLKGWTGMRGGLDVRSDSTGEHSIYADYQRYNIMFHVSTMLPYYPQDLQQVERKRHIGNDVVVIVWNEGRGYFDPNMMHSQMNHVYCVISPVAAKELPEELVASSSSSTENLSASESESPYSSGVMDWKKVYKAEPGHSFYKVNFASKSGVPPFGPFVHESALFPNTPDFREFLITKLINGERAALQAPAFSHKLKAARKTLLLDLLEPHLAKK
mmetsp:Transcript_6232/g.18926  ORF Transcript_6232/g.18926 Transcript_6232/m.18926 type:complete len:1045 (+) Transcript_6232:208-3342(+)|eukprot:CAMPEP_0174230986 /NCGR_PEP_ID=MMETSP0417-20130205/1614_1 /TAXON_ID=242541 /ORGANISM="Mayorella sp, Strain BSH-02190019" /LENGTH=1044 /DNA_ID=CAMNT_0015308771 /DNA_START=261 /DNA_END=3395 /DNA_ORIENTATION=-